MLSHVGGSASRPLVSPPWQGPVHVSPNLRHILWHCAAALQHISHSTGRAVLRILASTRASCRRLWIACQGCVFYNPRCIPRQHHWDRRPPLDRRRERHAMCVTTPIFLSSKRGPSQKTRLRKTPSMMLCLLWLASIPEASLIIIIIIIVIIIITIIIIIIIITIIIISLSPITTRLNT